VITALIKKPSLAEKRSKLICPICGKECKNQKGLKIHIKLRAKNYDEDHMDVLDNIIRFEGSRIVVKCSICGYDTVLNSQRKDQRFRDGFKCFNCDGYTGDLGWKV